MSDLINRSDALACFSDWVDSKGDVHSADEMPEYQRIEALPLVEPEPCDDPRADVYYLTEKIGIHRLYALVVELRGEPVNLP